MLQVSSFPDRYLCKCQGAGTALVLLAILGPAPRTELALGSTWCLFDALPRPFTLVLKDPETKELGRYSQGSGSLASPRVCLPCEGLPSLCYPLPPALYY